MTVGSLFSGIGGFDLGFARAGFEITWQVEIDDYASAVLAQHWPNVRRYRDVRTVTGTDLESVDVICGGFPCQPHSLAGQRGGSHDERDLWPQFARIIRESRPRWVVAENVSGLLSSEAGRFFSTILGDLAACGYDAEWDCLPAAAFGAPHRRDRVWIVAYPGRESAQVSVPRIFTAEQEPQRDPWWAVEPAVGRMAHGIPARLDRLTGLGNAIVPQIAEWIARQIKTAEGNRCAMR